MILTTFIHRRNYTSYSLALQMEFITPRTFMGWTKKWSDSTVTGEQVFLYLGEGSFPPPSTPSIHVVGLMLVWGLKYTALLAT